MRNGIGMTDKKDWHPEDVKAAIRKTGLSLRELSRRAGYDADSFQVALRRPWPHVEQVIAKHLRCTPWSIWPSRYDAKNRPLKRRHAGRLRPRDKTVVNTTNVETSR